MYVIEVIPLRRGTPFERLSYFSATPYKRGTLLSIPVRKKLSQGVVLSSQEVSLVKAALRGAPFLLRKLPAQSETQLLPSAFLQTADELAEYYAAEPGAALFALLPSEIKNGHVPIVLTDEKGLPRAEGAREHVHEVFQAPTETRIHAYQRIIRTSFAEGASVTLVVPTVEDGEFLFSLLETSIPQRIFFLHSGLGVRKLRGAYTAITENTSPILIIATPHHAFLTRDDVGTVILERSRSLAYRGHSRPYIDFRHALAVHARHNGQRLVTADTLIRTEEEFLLREHRVLPFEDNHPERITLPGALKTIQMKDKTTDHRAGQTVFTLFSPILLAEIEKTRALRERTFLFCARRGLAPIVACADCGMILRCQKSGSPLSLHRVIKNGIEERWLVSSVSGFRRKADDLCPACGSWRLRSIGIGVQHIYDELVRHFTDKDIFLFDHQSASTHKKATKIRDAFYAKKSTVLLGTALALPYLHEPVDMSAIVNMDALRAIPSWRQQEEAFGILLALREKTNGHVFVQTRADDDDVIRYARDGATGAYYTDELAARATLEYPPYSTFIHLTWKKNPRDTLTKEIAARFKSFNITVYGPPTTEDRIGYGLIRIPSTEWPQDTLVDALRSLPPSVRIVINPDRII